MKTLRIASACAACLLMLGACAQTRPVPAPAPRKLSMKETVSESGAPAQPASAKALYAAQCAGCHGQAGEKGLKGKSAEQVAAALKGYKAGTYGGAKKEIMQARAVKLSDADIAGLAQFVAGFVAGL